MEEKENDDKDIDYRYICSPSISYRHYMLNRGFRYLMISGDPWFQAKSGLFCFLKEALDEV